MITRAQFDAEVAALTTEMLRTGTPDDVTEKVLHVLHRLRTRLWPEPVEGRVR